MASGGQMDRKYGHVSRGDSADAERLAERVRADHGEFLAGFVSELPDGGVIQFGRYAFGFELLHVPERRLLAGAVPLVATVNGK